MLSIYYHKYLIQSFVEYKKKNLKYYKTWFNIKLKPLVLVLDN